MNHVTRPGRQCSHRRYLLSCEQYDQLLADVDHQCQLCGRPAEETGHGTLVLDHDARVGDWAVRGVLCGSCNNRIEYGNVADTEAAAAYLADPWFLRMLAKEGIALNPPEPDVGARITERGRTWTRTPAGWVCSAKNAPYRPQQWRDLIRRYGPHNVQR